MSMFGSVFRVDEGNKIDKDVEDWLKTGKREEAILLAARNALRALPMLALDGQKRKLASAFLAGFNAASGRPRAEPPDENFDFARNLPLPVFRAVSASWLAGAWENPNAEIAAAARTAAVAVAAAVSRADQFSGFAIRTAVAAAHAAGNGDALSGAARQAFAKFDVHGVNATVVDISAIENGATVAELSAMPLWSNEKNLKSMTKTWNDLKSRLPENEDWDVWTDWYEARLRGTPADKELEKARVLIPDEDWEQGPAHVNAIIKRLIAKHRLSFKKAASRRIAQNPKAAAASAEMERVRVAQRIEELRAALPNEPEALEKAQEEIAFLEDMQNSLAAISQQAQSLPEGAAEKQAEPAAAAVEDLAGDLKTWVTEYLTKERADNIADALVVGGLVAFLLWCGMPAWLAAPYLIARFNGIDVIEKIKAMLKKD